MVATLPHWESITPPTSPHHGSGGDNNDDDGVDDGIPKQGSNHGKAGDGKDGSNNDVLDNIELSSSLLVHCVKGAGNVQQRQWGAEGPEAEEVYEGSREMEGDEDGAAWQQQAKEGGREGLWGGKKGVQRDNDNDGKRGGQQKRHWH